MFVLFADPPETATDTYTDTARHLGKPFDFFTWLFFLLLHLLSYYCWPMAIIRTLNLYYYCTTLSPLLMAQWLLLLLYLFICHSLCVCACYCSLGLLSDQLVINCSFVSFFRYFFLYSTDWLTVIWSAISVSYCLSHYFIAFDCPASVCLNCCSCWPNCCENVISADAGMLLPPRFANFYCLSGL